MAITSYKRAFYSFLWKAALGAGVGAIGDWVVETFRIPVLNQTGTFGNKNMSNYEWVMYGTAMVAVAAGIYDYMGGGKRIFGFTRHAVPLAVGAAVGSYVYEHTIVNTFHLRDYNPYALLEKIVPPVLPPSPHLPGMVPGSGQFPGGLPPGPPPPLPR